jgi:hypothetical protein
LHFRLPSVQIFERFTDTAPDTADDDQRVLPSFNLFFLIYNKFPNFYVQIPAQLADQCRINSLKIVSAISVKIRPGNVQILANLVFANPSLFK